jgi:hypothetical protein
VGCSLALNFDGITGGEPLDGGSSDGAISEGAPERDSAAPVPDTGVDSTALDTGSDTGLDEGFDTSTSPETGQPDTSPVDTGQEDAPADTTMPRDSSPGSDVTEAAMPPFCASLVPAPVFCDDFDVHALPGVWDSLTQMGGTLALDTSSWVSPPHSLLATDSALAAGQPLNAALIKRFTLPAPPTTFTWSFELEPVAVDTTSMAAIVLASLDFDDAGGDRYSVQFTLEQDGGPVRLRLEEQSALVGGGNTYVPHTLPDPLPLGQWTNVKLVMTRTAATTASVQVTYGGTSELASTPLGMNVNATTLQLAIGSFYETEPSLGWTMRYDNVVLNF